MNKELISIIVPVYKVEKYLEKCLNSIINQTYKNIEIILIDDGSPDNCGKICDEYAKKDNRIIVIHKKNGGLSDARNKGLKKATGDYIMYVDSDDYIKKDSCEELIKVVKKTSADIICYNFNTIDEEGNKLTKNISFSTGNTKKVTELSYSESLIDNIYRKNIRYEAGSKLYKKSIIEKHTFPVGMLAEDFAVFYKYLKEAKKIVHFDYQIYNYLQRTDSIMGQKNKKLYKDIYITEKNFYKEVKSICNKIANIKQNENRHAKSLFKIYARLYSNKEDIKIQQELIEDIKLLDIKLLSPMVKTVFLIFKLNKKLFVKIFNLLHKKA